MCVVSGFVCVATGKQTGQLRCCDTLSLILQRMGQEVVGKLRLGAHQGEGTEMHFALLFCHGGPEWNKGQ